MSTTVTYKNLAFQHTPFNFYIRSIYGQKNYKAKNFSGIKTASRPWGWQFRQFVHPDSTYDVVYLRSRFSIRNHFNNSRSYVDTVFDFNDPLRHYFEQTIAPNGTILPVGTFAYEPSQAAFSAGGGNVGSPRLILSSIDSPTMAQTDITGSTPAGRYTADYELMEPFSLAQVIADVRARIAIDPNPDYDDPTNTHFYSDNWRYGFTGPASSDFGWIADSLKRIEPVPTEPYLLAHLSATQQLNALNAHAFNYWIISARKLAITIFNTRVNQLTIEKYCHSEWTRTQDQSNTFTFSAHRNCQMVTNPPGPRPFNILDELPTDDPLVQTNGVPVGTGSLGPNNPFAFKSKMIGNEFYFPGYLAAGYPSSGGFTPLPPPGPCCVLT